MKPSLVVGLLLVLISMPAYSMNFNVEKVDLRPIRSIQYFVYGSGEILPGDADRLSAALRSAGVDQNQDIQIYLDSPGGSVAEGLKLGRLISGLGANTSVGRQTADKPKPGECSSACVLAYLGGQYRYLSSDSELGVHQFALTNDKSVQPGTAIAVTQIVAAEIVELIKKNRADTDFFTLMTGALPSSIYFVPHEKLRELRVVTDNIWDEEWEFEFAKGASYLRIRQQSSLGENRLILGCDAGKLVGAAYIQPTKDDPNGSFLSSVGIFIDGELQTIPAGLVKQKVGKFVAAYFVISRDIADKMLTAHSIGAAMRPPNKAIFLGFQTTTTKGHDKLARMITGCK
jgi:hypothetical protein